MKSFQIRALSVFALAASAVASGTGCSAGDGSDFGSVQQADSGERAARLYLTDAVVQRLKQRAAANDAGWTALKARCDGLTGGTFYPPSANAYADYPNVGQGYQGDGYLPEIMNLGLCYRVSLGVDAIAAAKYGAAGAKLLSVMATPMGSGGQDPHTDDGYGIRNYGVGMATGFDWLYPALAADLRQQVVSQLNVWMDWYDTQGFSKDAPIGNYFAGYLLAKTTTAIATDGDNAKAPAYWADVQTRMWGQLVKPAFTQSMKGGGWPEGWQYGPRSVESYAQFIWAVKTGKGLDWGSEIPGARDQAQYITYFAWPSQLHMDDQGCVHSQARLSPPGTTMAALSGMLQYSGDAYASTARSVTADFFAANGASMDPWQKFLFWDDSLAKTPYTSQPLSYFASGPNHVAVRSSWQKDSVWGTFVSGTYIDAPDSGEQYFNQGSISIVHGDQPIVVNASGWLPQAGGDGGESFVYDDSYGSRVRKLNNSFFTDGTTGDSSEPTVAKTHIENYEEGMSFVHARGVKLEDMYTNRGTIAQFTRDFVYLRPGTFVVYDRTTVANAGADQWISWHTPTQPTPVATADATQRRFDVAANGATVGSINSLLPRNASPQSIMIDKGEAFRIESHVAARAASQDWLTVITAGASTPAQVRLSAEDGNVTTGGVVGVHVLGARNGVVLFNADHAAAAKTGAANYTVAQSAVADHVLLDMAAGTYSITASATGGKLTVDVKQGGTFLVSAQGSLSFAVAMDGTVTAGARPPPGPGPRALGNAGTMPSDQFLKGVVRDVGSR